jgi:hypothetical protein
VFRDLNVELTISERIALDRAARATDKRRLKKERKRKFDIVVQRFKTKLIANPERIRMRKEDIDYIYESLEVSRANK